MNDKFYLQGKDLTREIIHDKDSIRFDWNMLYACNYRCPCCFFDGKWEEYSKRTVYKTVKEWMKYWKRIYEYYGRVFIVITGGEPFIYPDFINLIKNLSEIHYPINISTNGSGDLNNFVKEIDPGKVFLALAFHPDFSELKDILAKVKFLKDSRFSIDYINFCAYPPYLDKLDKYVEETEKAGEKLKVIPYCGTYNSVSYPDGYTKDQKEKLGINEVWEKNVTKKGILCAAGYKTALIFPDGDVARCGQIGEKFIIGKIFTNDFELLDKPLPCEADMCPCLKIVSSDEPRKKYY